MKLLIAENDFALVGVWKPVGRQRQAICRSGGEDQDPYH